MLMSKIGKMKYLISERQYNLIQEIERQRGHFKLDPIDTFYELLNDRLTKKEKVKYFTKFFENKKGKFFDKEDDYFTSDVIDFYDNPFSNDLNFDVRNRDSISGLAYYIAKHRFGLKKGVDLDYMNYDEDDDKMFFFFDPNLKIFVGRITIFPEFEYFKNTYKVGISAADEELIGSGYGTRMYLTILKNVDYLLSDETLFSGSYRMWKHVLPKYVNVWGVEYHRKNNGKIVTKFTKIDPAKKVSVRKFDRFIGSMVHKKI